VSAALILASASPRRRAILEQIGVVFEVAVAEVEELTDGDPATVAGENARRKAVAAAERHPGRTVLAADTVVSLDGRILPKPRDAAQAGDWLSALSGREHRVTTAVCVLEAGHPREAVSSTEVRFRSLGRAEIDWYIASEEWRGKAGGYAIQGRGAALVESISGDYWTIVGLPVAPLLELLGPGVLTGG
jgi:septum formation protein